MMPRSLVLALSFEHVDVRGCKDKMRLPLNES
jgi:hypothetical protein